MPGSDGDRATRARQDLTAAVPPLRPTREELCEWGRLLGAVLSRPAMIALSGDLGAGKTTFARALCEGLGVLDMTAVTSPTYALVHEYPLLDGHCIHADLYRLGSAAELSALGWEEMVASAPVMLVEWPDRATGTLPEGTIQIMLEHDRSDPLRRVLRVSVSPGDLLLS